MNNLEKKIRAAIFPYDYEFETVCKYADLMKNIIIEKILSFQGWGIVGESVHFLDNDLIVEDCLGNVEFNSCDVLWIIESEHDVNDEYLIQISERFVTEGKDIVLSKKIEQSMFEKLFRVCEKKGRKLYSFVNQNREKCLKDDVEVLYNINTPIIAVYGMGEKTNKLEVQLELWKRLNEDGYNVFWISSGYEAPFFGGEHFPDFMYGTYSEKQKILFYNHFLKWIEREQKPDIFLLGVPGGIMPVSKKQVGYFGISAFEVFNAVTPDFTVFTLYYGDTDQNYLQEIRKLAEYKFNAETDVFYLSNVEQDIFSLDKITPVGYIVHDDSEVSERARTIQTDKNLIFCREDQAALYDYIIEKLSGYEEMETL